MSHYTEMKVDARVENEDDLVEALKAQFEEVKVHAAAVRLTGYDERAKREAHVVVPREAVRRTQGTSGYNDIGFERKGDGSYSLHYDPSDWPTSNRNKVMQDYTERVSTRKLRAKGYSVARETLKDGRVKLTASRWS